MNHGPNHSFQAIIANEEAYNRGDGLSAYIAKNALEKARPILGFHEYEPWRNEMDKQTGHAASVVRHALDRLNQ